MNCRFRALAYTTSNRLLAVFLWPPCVANADIMFLPCGFFLLSFSLLFFLAWSQRSQTGCLPYFYTWCGLSANLECRSEMCCTGLAGNTGRKNDAKIAICTYHRTTLTGYIFASSQLRHVSTIGKKNLLNSNIMSLQYGELRSTSGWDRFVSLEHPSKFQRVSRLGFVTAATVLSGSQPNWPSPGLLHYIYILRGSFP